MSATQLTVTVPASLVANSGTVNVTVTDPGGVASADHVHDYRCPPSRARDHVDQSAFSYGREVCR